MVKAILAALEEKAIEEYISSHPDTYYQYGRQGRERKFITSFGPIRYRLAQLYDRQTKKVFPPLVKSFRFFLINSIREKLWKQQWDK